jgi:hypothetical protein
MSRVERSHRGRRIGRSHLERYSLPLRCSKILSETRPREPASSRDFLDVLQMYDYT